MNRDVVKEVFKESPELFTVNTGSNCVEILRRVWVKSKNPDLGFVGKTRGEGQFLLPFPFPMTVKDDEGTERGIIITGISHDAMKWRTSGEVYDALGGGNHTEVPYSAPSHPQWAGPKEVRWNNPWVSGEIVLAGGIPPAQPKPSLPGREEMMNAGRQLHQYYRAPEGLQRPDGLWIVKDGVGQPDWEGIGAWLFDVYLQARVAGKTATEAFNEVISAIKSTDEWKEKHK